MLHLLQNLPAHFSVAMLTIFHTVKWFFFVFQPLLHITTAILLWNVCLEYSICNNLRQWFVVVMK